MEARLIRALLVVLSFAGLGASYRTPNFVVQGPTDRFAKQVGDAAEDYRSRLAKLWLGKKLPNWPQPCPIRLQVGPRLGAGGATSFVFDRGRVFDWQMSIQGSEKRILDSVLPHEVTHTIFATHFRRPLPRWADEGACTTVEHPEEKAKQQRMLIEFLQTDRGIAFSKMFRMKQYPRDILPLYSQGYSLARFLIEQWGRGQYINFLADGMRDENWSRAIRENYDYENLADLQDSWLDWVREGSPRLAMRDDQHDSDVVLASNTNSQPATRGGNSSDVEFIYRGQDPVRSAAAKRRAAKSGDSDAQASERSIDATAGEAIPAESTSTQVTRPQPYQQPQQRVIEWEQPNRAMPEADTFPTVPTVPLYDASRPSSTVTR